MNSHEENPLPLPVITLQTVSDKQRTVLLDGEKAGVVVKESAQRSTGLGTKKGSKSEVGWSGFVRWDGREHHFQRVSGVKKIVPKIEQELRRYEARKSIAID